MLDQALGGVTSLSLSSSNVLLTQLQAQNAMLRMTGTLTANVDVSPNSGASVLMVGFYYFENLTSGSFTVTMSNSAGSVALPQGRRGVFWIDTTNGPRIVSIVGSSTADPIPAGSRTLFYNTSVPAGWTVVAIDNYALKVVSSSGGVTSGSVGYTTVFGRTQVEGTTLTLNQIPSHGHTVTYGATSDNLVAGGNTVVTSIGSGANSASTGNAGGGSIHYHDIDMRVLTAAVLIGTRD